MWNNILQSAASALERTGEVITDKATSAVRSQKDPSKESKPATQALGDAPAGLSPTIVQLPPKKDGSQAPAESSQPHLTEGPQVSAQLGRLRDSVSKFSSDKDKQQEMLKGLQLGWGSVIEATKHAVEATKEVVEKEQARLEATFRKGPYKRDPKLPLDVDALRDAEVVYITDRLITMGHPAMQSSTDGDITADRKLAAVGHLLNRRHDGKYMVWNLSEVEYDYAVLDDQVLTYQFPGSPSPPLGMLLKLLISIESWLKADERNVAVLHCLTGRGRTSTVLAAFLCWAGEAGFHDPTAALEYIARCKRLDAETLTIPSQRRYASYFANMLDGVRPSQPPLLLRRIIMSEAPKFGKCPPNEQKNQGDGEENDFGCAPYLQIFKAGQLVFTTAAAMSHTQGKDDLPFCVQSDGPISFPIELVVQGDILVRCRHLSKKGQRVSMFRAAFHTGYVPPKVLRLSKSQLDGACSDKRFEKDFFLDLIFEACDAEMASQHLLSESQEDGEEKADLATQEVETEGHNNEAADRRQKGTIKGVQTASAYDTMLHRDSRFWDVISDRRKENMSRMASSAKGDSKQEDTSTSQLSSKFYGPTIGRRRDFSSVHKKGGLVGSKEKAHTEESSKNDGRSSIEKEDSKRKAIESFSIGGEFDFLVDEDEGSNAGPGVAAAATAVAELRGVVDQSPPGPPKRDELMEALMELDDEEMSPSPSRKIAAKVEGAEEEIVLDGDGKNGNVGNQHISEIGDKGGDGQPVQLEEKGLSSGTENEDDSSSAEKEVIGKATVSMISASSPEVDVTPQGDAVLKSSPESGENVLNNLGQVDLDLSDEDEGNMYGFEDDLDDDDDLEDLENFLTQASGN